jgi:hypothetical protein
MTHHLIVLSSMFDLQYSASGIRTLKYIFSNIHVAVSSPWSITNPHGTSFSFPFTLLGTGGGEGSSAVLTEPPPPPNDGSRIQLPDFRGSGAGPRFGMRDALRRGEPGLDGAIDAILRVGDGGGMGDAPPSA